MHLGVKFMLELHLHIIYSDVPFFPILFSESLSTHWRLLFILSLPVLGSRWTGMKPIALWREGVVQSSEKAKRGEMLPSETSREFRVREVVPAKLSADPEQIPPPTVRWWWGRKSATRLNCGKVFQMAPWGQPPPPQLCFQSPLE